MVSYSLNRVQLGLVGLMSATLCSMQFNLMAATPSQKLTLLINGLRSEDGVVCVSLFSSEDGFPRDGTKAIRNSCVPITDTPLAVSFDVPYGNYAVSLLHDENQDGRLNTGFLGIPREGIGFSNNPRIIAGTPSFATTKFEFMQGSDDVQVNIKYF
jgi:uncharacterized protein (DUF2141 family)